jgi:hypothetical protein
LTDDLILTDGLHPNNGGNMRYQLYDGSWLDPITKS